MLAVRPLRLWPSLVTTFQLSVFKIPLVVLTRSRLKVVSTLLRTIKTMVTRLSACSTTPSKVVTTVRVRRTFIVWHKFLTTSSIKWSLKVCHLLVNMAAILITVHSVAHKFLVHSMLVDKPANNFSWVLTQG